MSSLTFDELVDAAQHLRPEMQNVLVHMLRVAPPASTPDEALSVWEALREAGAFEATCSLCDSHVQVIVTPCEADLWAASQNMATVWEDDPSL
jgi:hypothetical protein